MTPAAWSSSNVVSGAAKFLPSHSLNSRLDCFVKPTVTISLRSPRKTILKALEPSCGAHSCATAPVRGSCSFAVLSLADVASRLPL